MKAHLLSLFAILFILLLPVDLLALSSVNIPLGSPIYSYIDKLAGLGLISSDFKGIRPLTKSEGARLIREAEKSSSEAANATLVTEVRVDSREKVTEGSENITSGIR